MAKPKSASRKIRANTKPTPAKVPAKKLAKPKGRVSASRGGAAAPDVTFREFQQLIRDRYFATDSARGVPGTFMWLIEEVGELATSLQDNAPGKTPTPTAEDRANLVEEFADVIAWLTTLANIANVDLAEALTKYTDLSRVKGVKS